MKKLFLFLLLLGLSGNFSAGAQQIVVSKKTNRIETGRSETGMVFTLKGRDPDIRGTDVIRTVYTADAAAMMDFLERVSAFARSHACSEQAAVSIAGVEVSRECRSGKGAVRLRYEPGELAAAETILLSDKEVNDFIRAFQIYCRERAVALR